MSSSADLIFAPYTMSAGKLSDSTSLSLISASAVAADYSESNIARYSFVLLSCFSVCRHILAKLSRYLKLVYSLKLTNTVFSRRCWTDKNKMSHGCFGDY